jgi:putative peptidoglycan lipid II flippase
MTGAARSRAGSLLIATAIVAFGFVGSRLLGIVRTAAIADAFGSAPDVEAYFVAFRVPDLIFQVLAGATLGSALVPVFARLSRREGEAEAWRLASHVLNLVTAGTAALCLVAFVAAPWLVPLTAPDLGTDIGQRDELIGKAVELTRIMLLSPLLFSMSGMVMAILNARHRFFLSALAPMLYNLAIIFGAVVLSGPLGVNGLAVGVVAGAALHLAVQVPGLVRERMAYQFGFGLHDPAVREVGRLMAPRVIGLAAGQFNFVITTIFASMVGASAIANLNYAWLLATLPAGLFAISISTAAFPRLAEMAADDDYAGLRQSVSRSLRAIMFLAIPAAVGLAVLREPVTSLVLERGAFTGDDRAATAAALGWYCLGIIPMAGLEIHSRAFYALADTRTPVVMAVVAMFLNLGLSAAFYRPFGIEGLAFAVSAAAWVEWGVLYALYLRKAGAPADVDLRAMALYAVAAAVMALVLAVGFAPFGEMGRFELGLVAVSGAVAGLCVYLGMAAFLRIPEFEEAVGRVCARMGR